VFMDVVEFDLHGLLLDLRPAPLGEARAGYKAGEGNVPSPA